MELVKENPMLIELDTAGDAMQPGPRHSLRYVGHDEGAETASVVAAMAADPASLLGGTVIDMVAGSGAYLTLTSYDTETRSFLAHFDGGSSRTLSHEAVRQLLHNRFVLEEEP